MHRVPADPVQVALGGLGPRVDQAPRPPRRVESLEHQRTQLGGHAQLVQHHRGGVRVVAGQADPLVAVHQRHRGHVLDLGHDRPLPLHQQHVPHMAGVLQR